MSDQRRISCDCSIDRKFGQHSKIQEGSNDSHQSQRAARLTLLQLPSQQSFDLRFETITTVCSLCFHGLVPRRMRGYRCSKYCTHDTHAHEKTRANNHMISSSRSGELGLGGRRTKTQAKTPQTALSSNLPATLCHVRPWKSCSIDDSTASRRSPFAVSYFGGSPDFPALSIFFLSARLSESRFPSFCASSLPRIVGLVLRPRDIKLNACLA